ncbi:MAG: hypothetical protein QY314_00630 [Candidatus Dojkabacteria bacterium]|nr:MAG: hypothetical protein QY314_00630 [Candidatus Dojkabacteria bacterium]
MKLVFDLQKIVEDVNKRRSRVKYSFQELALMLTEKLNDPRSKTLYMKLAKYEEQELIMAAYSYVIATISPGTNGGRLFMWKLKQLKESPIEPISLFLLANDDKTRANIGKVELNNRAEYLYLCAAIEEIREKYGNTISLEGTFSDSGFYIRDSLMFRIKNTILGIAKEFEKTWKVDMILKIDKNTAEKLLFSENDKNFLRGDIKIGPPVLTKTERQYRIPKVSTEN